MDKDLEQRNVAATLVDRHPAFAPATIERLVDRAFHTYDAAKIQTYVPVLVERELDAQLRSLDHDFTRHAVPEPATGRRAAAQTHARR